MRKIRETLRLRLEAGLSYRQISVSTKVSVGAIQKLLSRARELDLTWPLPMELDDARLAGLLYPGADAAPSTRFQEPDWADFHQPVQARDTAEISASTSQVRRAWTLARNVSSA